MLYGIDGMSAEPIGKPLDPLDDFELRIDEKTGEPVPSPCPFLIEGTDGIAVHRDPEAMLLEDEDLWSVVSEFKSGVPKAFHRYDYRTRSAWWMTAWGVLLGSHNRKAARDLEERLEGDKGDEGGPS